MGRLIDLTSPFPSMTTMMTINSMIIKVTMVKRIEVTQKKVRVARRSLRPLGTEGP